MADGIEKAIKMPAAEQRLRHVKHWRYISQHTVGYWAQVPATLPPSLLREFSGCCHHSKESGTDQASSPSRHTCAVYIVV